MNKNIALVEGLEWYRNSSNRGRGRLSAESSRLLKAGYLSFRWTSAKNWCLSITDAGRLALAQAARQSVEPAKLLHVEASNAPAGESAKPSVGKIQ